MHWNAGTEVKRAVQQKNSAQATVLLLSPKLVLTLLYYSDFTRQKPIISKKFHSWIGHVCMRPVSCVL